MFQKKLGPIKEMEVDDVWLSNQLIQDILNKNW